MGWIALEDMRFFAQHGFYPEEQLAGNEFIVDVYIQSPFEQKAKADQLSDTINYETVYFICQKVMKENAKLLEKLVYEIIQGLKLQFNGMQQVRVRLRKIRPMPGERLGSAYIEIEEDFRKKCPNCQRSFSCYNDGNCWCADLSILPGTLKELRTKFKGCLCGNCLKIYGRS